MTFCVDVPACPAGGEAKASIEAAVAAAASSAGKDRLEIGPAHVRY